MENSTSRGVPAIQRPRALAKKTVALYFPTRDPVSCYGCMAIVKRSDDMKGFVVPPRRWVVERTFSWFGRNRRLA